jgi:hypothetical protein
VSDRDYCGTCHARLTQDEVGYALPTETPECDACWATTVHGYQCDGLDSGDPDDDMRTDLDGDARQATAEAILSHDDTTEKGR